jgi:hypothetical protein
MPGTYIIDHAAESHGLVRTPAYIPAMMTFTGDEMSFIDRLTNVAMYATTSIMFSQFGMFVEQGKLYVVIL